MLHNDTFTICKNKFWFTITTKEHLRYHTHIHIHKHIYIYIYIKFNNFPIDKINIQKP